MKNLFSDILGFLHLLQSCEMGPSLKINVGKKTIQKKLITRIK